VLYEILIYPLVASIFQKSVADFLNGELEKLEEHVGGEEHYNKFLSRPELVEVFKQLYPIIPVNNINRVFDYVPEDEEERPEYGNAFIFESIKQYLSGKKALLLDKAPYVYFTQNIITFLLYLATIEDQVINFATMEPYLKPSTQSYRDFFTGNQVSHLLKFLFLAIGDLFHLIMGVSLKKGDLMVCDFENIEQTRRNEDFNNLSDQLQKLPKRQWRHGTKAELDGRLIVEIPRDSVDNRRKASQEKSIKNIEDAWTKLSSIEKDIQKEVMGEAKEGEPEIGYRDEMFSDDEDEGGGGRTMEIEREKSN
jgi:hypothetical protein